jgi:predicted RecB family nuclease
MIVKNSVSDPAPWLLSITARLVDLLPIVRNHVYHPAFDGSFSLKKVLPALVPERSYDDLPISEGATASLELERLMFSGDRLDTDEKQRLRNDLLRYCHQDTWGLVKLLELLRHLPVYSAGSSGSR